MFDAAMKTLYLKLANYALNIDGDVHRKLKKHIGKTTRVKTVEPYNIFYVCIRASDIFVTSEHDGNEDVRVRMPFRTLVDVVFGMEKISFNRDVRMEGDPELMLALTKIFEFTNLWGVFKGFLKMFVPEISSLDDFVKLLLGHEPSWLARFDNLPELNKEIANTLAKICDKQDKELFNQKEISEQLEQIKRQNKFFSLLLVVLSFHILMMSLGYIPH